MRILQPMKLLVVAPRFPLPLIEGDRLRLYHQLKVLSSHHQIILICLNDTLPSDKQQEEIKKFCQRIVVYVPARITRIRNALNMSLRGKPAQAGYFYFREMKQGLEAICRQEEPQLIYCQLIRTVEYVNDLQHQRMIIDFMDAFSIRASRLSFSNFMWKVEEKFVRRYEKASLQLFSRAFAISSADAVAIGKKVEVLPNGVDTQKFKPGSGEKEWDLLFVGNLGYRPNFLAVKFLIEKVAKPLKQRYPYLQVCIAGANPPPEISAMASKWIHVTGYVSDITKIYQQATIMVAPLFAGSGMQNKVLESMACGLPCLTTPWVREAIGAPESILLTASDKDEFLKKIELLLEDKELRRHISDAGRTFVVQKYSWDKVSLPLLKAIERSVLEDKTGR